MRERKGENTRINKTFEKRFPGRESRCLRPFWSLQIKSYSISLVLTPKDAFNPFFQPLFVWCPTTFLLFPLPHFVTRFSRKQVTVRQTLILSQRVQKCFEPKSEGVWQCLWEWVTTWNSSIWASCSTFLGTREPVLAGEVWGGKNRCSRNWTKCAWVSEFEVGDHEYRIPRWWKCQQLEMLAF